MALGWGLLQTAQGVRAVNGQLIDVENDIAGNNAGSLGWSTGADLSDHDSGQQGVAFIDAHIDTKIQQLLIAGITALQFQLLR